MSDQKPEVVISVKNLIKKYKLYRKKTDRLKEVFSPFKKQYHKDFKALNNISFDIRKGETVGIIGKNGSGKSTLLKLLTGVLTSTTGSIDVKGKVSALLELGAGFNPNFTGLENLYFNGSIMGYSKAEMDSRVDSILEFADIGEFVKQPVKMYSSGMFVRLAFSLAINVDPDILIVDEALAVGDARFQLKCFQKFEDFRKAGKTIIFVSHSMADIVRSCKRAIWINDGVLCDDGDAKKVTEEYISWLYNDVNYNKLNKITAPTELSVNSKLSPIPKDATVSGEGGIIIKGIGLFDENEKLVNQLSASQRVKIKMQIEAQTDIDIPYLSFHIIDSKGLDLLGSNNHVLKKKFPKIVQGEIKTFSFEFMIPEINNGNYFISIGINDGEQNNPNLRRLIYVVDAYQFSFSSSSIFQTQGVLFKLHDCICSEEDEK